MSVLERAPADATAEELAPPRGGRELSDAALQDLVRLGTFFALAVFASLHWAGLVAEPPAGRVLGAVVAATAAGALMVALKRGAPRAFAYLGGLVLVLVVAGLTLTALGLQPRLLWPANWNDLGAELDRGLSGIRTVTWPYAGSEEAVRLVILLGIAPLLTLAAALTFWPARGRRTAAALRALGLITLLCLYGVPVTDHDPGSPVTRGVVLLLLVAAWLWLPRLRRREAVPAAVLVTIAALIAVPVAGQLNRDSSLVDYSQWNWFGGKEVTFDWNHSYGPLDWPREGTTMLEIRSRQPLYWKAEVLDRFDGLRWNRSETNDRTSPLAEVPADPDTRWDRSVRVNVRSLRTDFVVGTGTPYRVTGAGQAITGSADGTLRRLSEPLQRGDEYTVQTYAPTPNASELRNAPREYDSDLSQYTAVNLPGPGDSALRRNDRQGFATRPTVQVPLTSEAGDDSDTASLFADSPYARTYRLAQRLTSGQPTVYDSVRRVRDYLQQGFRYSERPPASRYPLESFLFKDKIGYCQQFSGAMALMLRMSGIPARVATGFSPGSYDRESGTYRVRDLDAHSWVEVYFAGTGWVTFDPTPPAAPADRAGNEPQAPGNDGGENAAGALTNNDPDNGNQNDPLGNTPEASGGNAGATTGGDGSSALSSVAVAGIGLAAIGAVLGAGFLLLRRRRPRSAEQRLDELQRALPRLGWNLPGGTTLLDLERRLGRDAGPASAAYVAGLRSRRFASSSKAGEGNPGGDRGALRRELTAKGGLRRRVRGFLALPPTRRGA